MKGFIVDRTYRIIKDAQGKEQAYVYLFGRLANGASFLTISSFKPFFYIKAADLAKAKRIAPIEHEETRLTTMDGASVVKVILTVPRDVPKLRQAFEDQGIPCFEADIRFTQRFLMEQGIYATLDIHGRHKRGQYVDRIYEEPILTPVNYTPALTTLSFDIETSMDGKHLYCLSLVLAHTGGRRSRILFLDHDERQLDTLGKDVELFTDEKSLLERFAALVKELDPDVITGWNCIDFDLAFLKGRFDHHKLPFRLGRTDWECALRLEKSYLKDSTADVPGRQVLDGIHLLRSSFVRLDDYKLETAAQAFLSEGKLVKGDDRHEEITRLYHEEPAKLIAYNLRDSELVLDILDKLRLVELTTLRSMLTGLTMERVRASIASFDSVYIRQMRQRGLVAPSNVYNEKAERITGGYVMQSRPGIYEHIVVLDFKSMYPSVIRTFNIDPVSYLPECTEQQTTKEVIVAPNKACFRKEDGLLPAIIQRLWEQRDKAKKRKDPVASLALKTLMNSFFGVLASPNCRFFSLNMANAITHFAQHFIKLAIEKIEGEGYEVIYGDSITKERPLIIREHGLLKIVTIEELYERFSHTAKQRRGKEVATPTGIETLSFDPRRRKACFKPILEIIRHRAKKKIYRVNQKYGETRCTEDHSLISEDLQATKPAELQGPVATIKQLPRIKQLRRIDLLDYLKAYHHTSTYKGREKDAHIKFDQHYLWFSWTKQQRPVKLRRHITFPSREGDALLRLLGFYVAEGSNSTPETTHTRWGATLAGPKEELEQYRRDYLTLFTNTTATIIPSQRKKRTLTYQTSNATKKITYHDKTHKLNMMNQLAAVFFKQLAGQKSTGKKIPDFLYHLPRREQEIFLNAYLAGDGSRTKRTVYTRAYRERHFRCTTRSLRLAAGLTLLLKQLGYTFSVQYRPSKQAYTISTSDQNNTRLTTKITEENYDGHVYDLAVADTHLFADGCGQLLLHNTDSVFVKTGAPSVDQAAAIGTKIQKHINAFYDEYVEQEYGRRNYMELEAEKVYRKFLMPTVRGGEKGAKKRYAGLLVRDGKEKLDFTGLEFVRRDWTEVSKRFQLELLDRIFHEREVTQFVRQFVTDVKDGRYDALLIYKKSLRKPLAEYTKTTPPHVKAARILERKLGGAPHIIEYIMTKNGPEPVGHETAEIDYDHYIEKQLKPIADSVLGFFGTTFDDLIAGSSQQTLFGY